MTWGQSCNELGAVQTNINVFKSSCGGLLTLGFPPRQFLSASAFPPRAGIDTSRSRYRFARRMRLTTLALIVFGSAARAPAQVAPLTPLLPTSIEECQAFGRRVDEYTNAITQEHERCLQEHAAANSNEKPGSSLPRCTRPPCQRLHDQLFGDSPLLGFTVKERQAAVSQCFIRVKNYLDQQAKKKQEEDESNAKHDTARQEEHQKQQADRAAADRATQGLTVKRKQPLEDRKRRQIDKTEQLEFESRGYQAQKEQAQLESESQKRRAEEKQKAEDAIAALKDPFAKAKDERRAMRLEKPENALVDPFADAHRPNSEITKPKEDQERSALALHAFDISTKGVEQNIDASVEAARSQVSKSQLSKSAFAKFKAGADDTKSVCSGVAHTVRGLEYGAVLKDLYEAHAAGDEQRTKYEEEKLAWEIGKDTVWQWSTNAAKQGVGKVITQLFPKTGPYVARGLTAASAGLSTFFYSSEIGLEHDQVIFDTSGQFSLEDKQKVLFHRWKLYDRNPSAWNASDLKVLINETDTIYNQSVRENSTESGARE
jgi:hypothetical protein